MEIKTDQFVATAARELKNSRSRMFLSRLAPYFTRSCLEAMKTFPEPKTAIEYGRAIRGDVIFRLPELLQEFEKNATACGAQVVWAKDAIEANEFILNLARKNGITYVTKGKSMVTEEMGLNDYLRSNGIEPFETDLGEFIIQQLDRPPFHIVGPAINLPVEEIRDLFLAKGFLTEPTTDRVKLGAAARVYLREKFCHLQMGITGVNMAVADTGAIINVENEGNIRLCKSSPQIQVSIMTLEKVVPTMADAMHIARLLCRHCTGQKLSSYVSIDCGPRKARDVDGPDELYIIILDNGRTEIYQDLKGREALRCIRCGACLNACPVYGTIGGYPYGWAYSGPMGQMLNPLLLGLDKTYDLYHATTLCGACKEVCPAGIDHPGLFLQSRARHVHQKGLKEIIPGRQTVFFSLFGWGIANGKRWRFGVKLMRPFVNHYAKNGVIGKMFKPLDGWFKSRNLPAIASRTFHERWRKIRQDK